MAGNHQYKGDVAVEVVAQVELSQGSRFAYILDAYVSNVDREGSKRFNCVRDLQFRNLSSNAHGLRQQIFDSRLFLTGLGERAVLCWR